ncbi:hypothetical protein ANN_17337 [Periplaneta americana]|uniref:Uncharacterized protein n=1 Tax=Periplaneta americana TaxID=6978 RepID=A0ABQ8SSN6_PERAM|nr:hypothetical protein ANN_17337 [Periplaneta americana]
MKRTGNSQSFHRDTSGGSTSAVQSQNGDNAEKKILFFEICEVQCEFRREYKHEPPEHSAEGTLQNVRYDLDYRLDVYCVTKGAHTGNL